MNESSNAVTLQAQPQYDLAQLDAASLILGPSWDRIQAFGKMMARGQVTVPRHLAGNEADCAAIAMQAIGWRMNPYAVAQKTHITQGGTLGYEAQLVNAVIQASGALDGDPDYEYLGDWDKVLGKVEERKSDKGGKYYVATYTRDDERGLGVIVKAKLRGEAKTRELTVMMSQAWPRFSTQWATDPKQQISYLAMRKFVRLHKPGVILGVYTNDELDPGGPTERFMGPADVVGAPPAPPPPAPATYDQAEFDKNLAKWEETIRSGRKTADFYIHFAESRGKPYTDEQKAKLRVVKVEKSAEATDVTPKPAPAAAPATAAQQSPDAALAYAEIADRIVKAQSIADLDDLAEHIGAIADEQQRAELVSKVSAREQELPPF